MTRLAYGSRKFNVKVMLRRARVKFAGPVPLVHNKGVDNNFQFFSHLL